MNAKSLMGLCIVLKFSVFFLLVKNHISYDCIFRLHEMIVSLNPTFPTTYPLYKGEPLSKISAQQVHRSEPILHFLMMKDQ